MIKKLKDMTDSEIRKICEAVVSCDQCPLNNHKAGCGKVEDDRELEIDLDAMKAVNESRLSLDKYHAYVVIEMQRDDDGPTLDWLVSCATFSDEKSAQQYVMSRSINMQSDLRCAEIQGEVDGLVKLYDCDDKAIVATWRIIFTVVDEFRIP